MVRRAVIILVLLTAAAIIAAVWHTSRRRATCGFLDFREVPRLTLFRSHGVVESQRFEAEWETLKQACNLAHFNISLDEVDVDQTGSFEKPPSLRFRRHGSPEETYRGPLTSDALLAYVRSKLKC